MSYPYSLPTTGTLSFADYFETSEPYNAEISDATAQRGRLRTVLKELKKETHSARDYQTIVNVTMEKPPCIPTLLTLFLCKDY